MTYNRVNIAFYLTQNYNTHINIFASNAKEIKLLYYFSLLEIFFYLLIILLILLLIILI
jgi:hypothetical protein